jgi:hypothetical protein
VIEVLAMSYSNNYSRTESGANFQDRSVKGFE